MPTTAPFGSWASPISAIQLADNSIGLSQPVVDGDDVYWLESRPAEGGRQVVVRSHEPFVSFVDVVPPGFSARTLVHEYGGGDFTVHHSTVYFSNFDDQRLYRIEQGGVPEAITPDPDAARALRYADMRVSADGRWIVCVREHHRGDRATDVVNEIVAVPTDGSRPPHVLASGHDFYAAPRLAPDGRRLAWFCWDHPRMPWDGTELWVAEVGEGMEVGHGRLVRGGVEESVTHPVWGRHGELYFATDANGWWNLHVDDGATSRPLLPPTPADFAKPPWGLGESSFTLLADGTLACTWSSGGVGHLGVLSPSNGSLAEIPLPFSSIGAVAELGSGVVALAASPRQPAAVVAVDMATGEHRALRTSAAGLPDEGYISVPEAIEFPTEDGLTAHAFYYAPTNRDFEGPVDERPPLLVLSHGGPTGAALPTINLGIQYWTSRGIAVVDVNYGGSTGFGRPYRERLKGKWGVVDVDDCINAATFLVARGAVDGGRLAIRGGSAGGYTTLCALAFRPDVFAVGASYYGVADAAALASETHKFESRYLDGLIGPYPEAKDVYDERSPINFVDRIASPLILFQGLDDRVVPPAQAEMMLAALRAKKLPVAYVPFEGEGHGFRKAENIVRATEAQLSFFGHVLGFVPADDIEPVEVFQG